MAYYYCDPDKNYQCQKCHCFLNGGRCQLTDEPRFSTDRQPLNQSEGWGNPANRKRGKAPVRRNKAKLY